jgi:hypothetical protein
LELELEVGAGAGVGRVMESLSNFFTISLFTRPITYSRKRSVCMLNCEPVSKLLMVANALSGATLEWGVLAYHLPSSGRRGPQSSSLVTSWEAQNFPTPKSPPPPPPPLSPSCPP